MKTCFKCKETKSIDDFYRHGRMADGHLNKCKECTKNDVKINARTYPDELEKREKIRNGLHHRVLERAEYLKKYRRCFPEKDKAHAAVARALKVGALVRVLCPCGRKSVAHHEDYSKPLEVVWLCQRCHKRYHADRGDR